MENCMEGTIERYHIFFLRFCKEENAYIQFIHNMNTIGYRKWPIVERLKDRPTLTEIVYIFDKAFAWRNTHEGFTFYRNLSHTWQHLVFENVQGYMT